MKTLLSSATLFIFLAMSISSSFAAYPIRVVNGNNQQAGLVSSGNQQVGLANPSKLEQGAQIPSSLENAMSKSLDEIKDMCLNPQKFGLQAPLIKLEITGVLSWTKWIKNVSPVFLVESQKLNTFGAFTKNGRNLDGKEWQINNGKLSNVTEGNTACVVEGSCTQYVEHAYTRDMVNKTVACEDIIHSSSVEQLYGLTLENLTEMTSIVPAKGDVLPPGFSDQERRVFPAACPVSAKPDNIPLCNEKIRNIK